MLRSQLPSVMSTAMLARFAAGEQLASTPDDDASLIEAVPIGERAADARVIRCGPFFAELL
jgi:hypothetical protein